MPLAGRAAWLIPALAVYCGLILIPFHEPISWESADEPSALSRIVFFALVFVWFFANGVIVKHGNVLIASIACIGIWWLAQRLYVPWSDYEDDDSIAGGLPTIFGFLNLMFFWAAFSVRAFSRRFGWPRIRRKTAS